MNVKLTLGTCLLAIFCQHNICCSAENKDMMIRVRALGVLPDVTSTITPIGGNAKVSNSFVPEIDFTYFFNNNIAFELIAATARHKVKANGTIAGDVDVGSAWILPPTLTLQYHATQFAYFKPYIGAGINYTFFYNEKPGILSSVEYKDNASLALQAGFDIPIVDNCFYANVDVKKLFLKTTANFNNGAIIADVDLDPWLVGAGIAYRF